MLGGTSAERLNENGVAGEATSTERRKESDSFDSGLRRQTVRLLEGETTAKEEKQRRRDGPGRSSPPWAWMSPNTPQHGERARPPPLVRLDFALDGRHPACAFQRLENPGEILGRQWRARLD